MTTATDGGTHEPDSTGTKDIMTDIIKDEYRRALELLAESLPYATLDGGTLTIGLKTLCATVAVTLSWWDDDSEYESRDGVHWTEWYCDEGRSRDRELPAHWMSNYLNTVGEQPISNDPTLNLLLDTAAFCDVSVEWFGGLD